MRKRSGCTPRHCYQTPPVKDLQMRSAQTRKATSLSTSETTKVQQAVRVFCTRYRARAHPKWPVTTEPVNRSLCVLRFGRPGQRAQRYSGRRRESQRSAERVPCSFGGRHQTTGPGQKRAKVPAGYR